jgi:Flp pilus assembly protein TadD
VPDEYAQALFYNNLAAEALVSRNYDTSFTYLREALRLDAENTAAWSNLGLWYLRQGRRDHAEAAYLRALDATPRDPTVLTNLAALYASQGQPELADAYSQRIRSYQKNNPYYHFAAALKAFEQRRFDAALNDVNQAVRLKTDENEFHVLRARTSLALGRTSAAARSFARAEALGAAPDLRAMYEAETGGLLTDGQQ